MIQIHLINDAIKTAIRRTESKPPKKKKTHA